MVRITDDHSKVASLKPEVREREPVVFYDRPIDNAWRYVVHGRRELWQCDSLFRESALRGLGGLVERLRRHSELHPGIGMVLTYRDITEPGWQENVGREIRDGEMWVAKQVAVRSIAFREQGLLVDFVAPPGSTHAVRNLLDLLTQAASWCRGLVRRDDMNDPLLWWALELVRLAWGPHPTLHAQRKFRHDGFGVDVEHFAAPRAPDSVWSAIYKSVGTAPRSWYAELSVDLASASAYLAEYFIVKLGQQSQALPGERGPALIACSNQSHRASAAVEPDMNTPEPLLDERQKELLIAMLKSFGNAARGHKRNPSAATLAKAASGGSLTSACKVALAELVELGLLGNGKHDGGRGGYYLTEAGRAHAQRLINKPKETNRP